ncbi:hypothetical protein M9Y10_015588 [Tritrichomonas musculus]|uniref:Surface antigen BspA-like n=1 Tax=Tritrichomonas musculus TaxID=1915356 RepID=A0ABR2L2P5_9EUKA
MEVEIIIQRMKKIYSFIMEFIDSNENVEIDDLIQYFESQEILNNKEEITAILKLLSIIADNHHRSPNLISKLETIFQFLFKEIGSIIPDLQIYKIFRNNKRVLLLFFERGFIQPNEYILSDVMVRLDSNRFPYRHYLYSGLELHIDKEELKTIENEIKQKYDDELETFIEKCRIGENDSYLCSLIREDSVEEFISYINRSNISTSIEILPSIFETNLFLMNRETTMIEYATFYGSTQIIQYLTNSNVKLTGSLWLYAIHSDNADLIHFLERNEVDQEEKDEIYKESIKCHHNNIADYLKDNYLDNDDFESCYISSYNYHYFPSDIGSMISKSCSLHGFNVSRLYFQLKQITVPSSATSIGRNAFANCFSLEKIIIPSSVSFIDEGAFYECSSLKEITIPSSVTSIESDAFRRCFLLVKIAIPSSVKSIGDFAFSECSSLAEISIPSSVESIGDYAFSDCSALSKIEIPSSVSSIKSSTFSGCSSLTEVVIPSSVEAICDFAFSNCSSLAEISIPSSVKSIGNNAFSDCAALSKIEIPSSVSSIKSSTFSGCSSLTQISIPKSVVKIQSDAFDGCCSLSNINLPLSINVNELNLPPDVKVTNVETTNGNNCQIY